MNSWKNGRTVFMFPFPVLIATRSIKSDKNKEPADNDGSQIETCNCALLHYGSFPFTSVVDSENGIFVTWP